jgi:secreted trypsin-like serine protease
MNVWFNLIIFHKVERSSFADCGVSNDVNRMADGKIAGGVETAPNEFPWQAYLQVEMENGDTYNCGGSLISERWILSSATNLVMNG